MQQVTSTIPSTLRKMYWMKEQNIFLNKGAYIYGIKQTIQINMKQGIAKNQQISKYLRLISYENMKHTHYQCSNHNKEHQSNNQQLEL